MSFLSIPFHFTVTFVLALAAFAAVWVTVTRPDLVPSGKLARRGFGAGWMLIALGEVMHGSLLAPTDLDQALIALKSGAYGMLVLSLLKPDRGKGKKSTAAAAASPGNVLMPAALCAVAAYNAFRYPTPGTRRLASAFALLAVSEALIGAGGSAVSGGGGFVFFVAHLLRLGAGVSLGTWLWQAVKGSLRARFVSVVLALVLAVVIGIAGSMTAVFSQNVAEEATQRAVNEGEVQKGRLDDQIRSGVERAKQLSSLSTVRDPMSRRDPGLAEIARFLQSPGGPFDTLDFLAFLGPGGDILALSAEGPGSTQRLGQTDAVSLAGADVVQSALQRVEAGSLDTLGTSDIAVIAAFPVNNPPGTDPPGAPPSLAGVVVVGQVLDERFVRQLAREEEQDAFLIDPDSVLATTVTDPRGVLEPEGPMRQRVFEQGTVFTTQVTIGPTDYFSSYVPLERTDGQVIGALVVAQRSEVLELTRRNVGRTLFLLALFAAAMAVALAYVTGTRITRPITELTSAAERVSQGEWDRSIAETEREDEIGVLTRAFDQMTSSLGALTADLRGAAAQEYELRSRLQTVLQSMADGVVAVDENGKVVAFNREAERLLEVESADAIGRPVQEVLLLSDGLGHPVSPHIYEFGGGSLIGLAGKGTRRRTVSVTSAPIVDENGDNAGGVALVKDLTEQQQVERMKTEFLSNISHELRTPLTPIKGYSDLLRRKNVPRAKAVGFLDEIQSGALRLERIVEMLVDFSAMEAGRLVPRLSPLDLDKLVAGLVSGRVSGSPKHRIERTGFSKLTHVHADPRLLPLAIGEIIDNALKFSPDGGRVQIAAERLQSNGTGWVALRVSDQGIGMSKRELAKIGGDFVQADASETRSFGGLGLGLAYARRIVEAHGGRLEVESQKGKGTTVSIWLPQPTPAGRTSASSRGPSRSIDKKTTKKAKPRTTRR